MLTENSPRPAVLDHVALRAVAASIARRGLSFTWDNLFIYIGFSRYLIRQVEHDPFTASTTMLQEFFGLRYTSAPIDAYEPERVTKIRYSRGDPADRSG